LKYLVLLFLGFSCYVESQAQCAPPGLGETVICHSYDDAGNRVSTFALTYQSTQSENENSELESALTSPEEQGIETIDSNSDIISVYPNPTHDVLIIELNLDEYVGSEIRLFDSSGQLSVQDKIKDSRLSIDVSKLPAGAYLLKIGDGDHSWEIIKN